MESNSSNSNSNSNKAPRRSARIARGRRGGPGNNLPLPPSILYSERRGYNVGNEGRHRSRSRNAHRGNRGHNVTGNATRRIIRNIKAGIRPGNPNLLGNNAAFNRTIANASRPLNRFSRSPSLPGRTWDLIYKYPPIVNHPHPENVAATMAQFLAPEVLEGSSEQFNVRIERPRNINGITKKIIEDTIYRAKRRFERRFVDKHGVIPDLTITSLNFKYNNTLPIHKIEGRFIYNAHSHSVTLTLEFPLEWKEAIQRFMPDLKVNNA